MMRGFLIYRTLPQIGPVVRVVKSNTLWWTRHIARTRGIRKNTGPTYTILVSKRKIKRSFLRPRYTLKGNIGNFIKEIKTLSRTTQ
jgi:hypothetical protein